MRLTLKKFFIPPTFDDEEKTRHARIIHIVYMGLLFTSITASLIDISRNYYSTSYILIPGNIPLAYAYFLNRRGKTHTAGFMLLTVMLIAVTTLLILANGIHDIAITALPVLLILSAVVLNRRGVTIFTILVIVAIGLVVFTDINGLFGWHTTLPTETHIADFYIIAFVLSIASIASHIMIDNLLKNLDRLRISEARLRGIINNTTDFIMEINREGIISLINHSESELIGKSVKELVPNEYAQQVEDTIERAFTTGDNSTLEIQTYAPSGMTTWDSIRIGPIKTNNEVTSLAVIITDITEMKRVALERENLIAELERRNAELERYTYTLSHELKTPIVTIRGFMGLLTKDIKEENTEKVGNDLSRIGHAADKMYKMISELIELSRIGRLTNPPEDVPFEEIVIAGLNNVEASKPDHKVKINIQPSMPIVHVDLTRMIEVIQILIENSIKYGGTSPIHRSILEYAPKAQNQSFLSVTTAWASNRNITRGYSTFSKN